MVAPLNLARGTQNKILEAMATGIPVVASRACAGGVDAIANEHFVVADTAEEYVESLVRIMCESDWRKHLSIVGRERMLSHHSWTHSMERLDEIIDRCFSDWRRRGSRTVNLRSEVIDYNTHASRDKGGM
jgi:glycosyltransferase involved in cell wall biosynthesis